LPFKLVSPVLGADEAGREVQHHRSQQPPVGFGLEAVRADLIGVGAQLRDELGRRRDRDVRDGVVQHVPETGDTGGQTTLREQHAGVGPGQPFGFERLIGIRLGVARTETAIHLVQRRRAEAAVSRSSNGHAVAQPVCHRRARVE